MADIAIEPIAFKSLFMASLWRGTAPAGAAQLESALNCALPDKPNRFTEKDGIVAACLIPGRYLLLAETGQLYPAAAGNCDPALVSLVQLDHSRKAFRVSGPQAARLLMKGVAIDLDEAAFPAGSLFQSSIHDIGVVGLRRGASSFDLLVYTSFADSFEHWLRDAAMEFS
ncbi:sarcosine oxidase subunit gamma [Paraurantiacibacter namhicola]|uniref:Sarcosine oxidase, gamma subunit family n=1 Tax=Paraurantiacibacter namhicola TaxID=645517 RepID=A0A1C7D502_9SPHN|nr:sarcosine oxidase subunit gamma family protein [Paraurantiacibacter namhicola]ANU06432.1 Sarcosine oxidase, gamma subunit family [Paraurantiacibacter namhicola]